MTINVSSVGRVARLEINNTQIIFAVTLPFKWQLSAAGTRGFWHVTHPNRLEFTALFDVYEMNCCDINGCLPNSPKPDSPKLGLEFWVRVRVSVSANRVSANRDWTY